MAALYSTRVTSTGGRNGSIRSEDGLLELGVALPQGMGGAGDKTNPEQLFAGGFAACFGNAVIHVARRTKQDVKDADVTVIAEVSIAPSGQTFGLSVSLDVTIAGLDQATAEKIVEQADATCPYSNAVRNNIPKTIAVHTK